MTAARLLCCAAREATLVCETHVVFLLLLLIPFIFSHTFLYTCCSCVYTFMQITHMWWLCNTIRSSTCACWSYAATRSILRCCVSFSLWRLFPAANFTDGGTSSRSRERQVSPSIYLSLPNWNSWNSVFWHIKRSFVIHNFSSLTLWMLQLHIFLSRPIST